MNKQELLEEIVKLDIEVSENFPHYDLVDKEVVLALINQLDEPEKPIIPQFVADWIESQDDPIYEMCVNYEMWGVNGDDGTTSFTGEIAEWFDDTLNVENYYRACIDGYEVEKEKLYKVVLPTGRLDSTLVAHTDGMGHFFSGEHRNDSWYKSHLTEQEIKAIDERYWVFAEEVTE